jgi:hypothetical protein
LDKGRKERKDLAALHLLGLGIQFAMVIFIAVLIVMTLGIYRALFKRHLAKR